MKVQFLSTSNGMQSSSLKRLAEALSQELGYKVWRTTHPRTDRKQFVYGDGVDKLTQYQWFQQQQLSALTFTTDQGIAEQWVAEGACVFGRRLLNASCGDGIVIYDDTLDYAPAGGCPVYTLYKPKKREWRVHIFKDRVVSIVEKKRRSGFVGGTSKIRNLANGYVFCQDIDLDPVLQSRVELLGLAASKVCSSDFKGVDIAYNEKQDDVFVIEVNSAPGIEGSNVSHYINVMKEFV